MTKKTLTVLLGMALAIVLAFAALAFVASENGMFTNFIIAELKTAVRCLMSLVGVVLLSRFLDLLTGFNFKLWLSEASSEDKAKYLSARFVGLCVLFGLLATGAL